MSRYIVPALVALVVSLLLAWICPATTLLQPSVPGLPNIPAIGQQGYVITPDTIRPTVPGLPYPSLTDPGVVVAPDSPRPHLIPVFPCAPPADDADGDQ